MGSIDPLTKRWIRSAADERAVAAGCWFEEAAAERAAEFFRGFLVHSKGQWAGKPFELLTWQYEDVIGPLFGWKRKDGSRRYRRAYVEVPKKNGKSTLASGIALYMLIGDGEAGSHVFSAAADRDQASLVYDEAANMVEASGELAAILEVRRSTKRILYWPENAKYEAISSDADSAQGLNAHAIVMDELHAWRNREFYESLMYAGRARRQPLLFIITTAGDSSESIGWEIHDYAARVLSDEIEAPNLLAYIRAAGLEDDWRDPETWAKANPSLGHTLSAETLREDCLEAQDSPAKENAFKRYSLDVWGGASDAWLSLVTWDRNAEPFDECDLYGLPAYAGVDLSISADLSSVVWLVPLGDEVYLIPRVYVPRAKLQERERLDRVPYRSWADQGLIRLTPGETIDYSVIRRDVLEDAGRFKVKDIGYDPYNAHALCEQQLGCQDGLSVTSVMQSMTTMGPASKEFEKLLESGRIRHGGHPVLRWMASGAVLYVDTNDNYRPVKKRSTTRIDGLIASLIAMSRYMANQLTRPSVYSRPKRGLLFVE